MFVESIGSDQVVRGERFSEKRSLSHNSDPIVVIVLSFNKKDVTLQCLKSVQDVNYSPYEVLVVDNGSTDGSAEAIAKEFPTFHLLRNLTNLGPAGGRNAGIDYVNTYFDPRYVFFLDNDTLVERDILVHLSDALKADPRAGVACSKAYQRFPSNTLFSVGMYVNFYTASIYDIGCGQDDKGQFDTASSVPACGAFGMLIKQEVLESLRGWDDRFNPYGWEEVDLCLRARKLGYETIYVPKAIMYHAGGKVGRGVVPQYETYKVKHFFLLLKKHATRLQYASCLIWMPFRGILLAFRLLRQGKFHIVGAQMRGVMKYFTRGNSFDGNLE